MRQPICGTGWFGVGAGFYPELYSNVPGMDYIDRHHYYGGGPGGWQILQGMPFNHERALTEPKHLLKLGHGARAGHALQRSRNGPTCCPTSGVSRPRR